MPDGQGRTLKVCVFGAGAIGGFVGAELSRVSDLEVSVVARGEHLAAIRDNGLRLRIDGKEHVVHPRCTDDPEALGAQDYVIIALKATRRPPSASDNATSSRRRRSGRALIPTICSK